MERGGETRRDAAEADRNGDEMAGGGKIAELEIREMLTRDRIGGGGGVAGSNGQQNQDVVSLQTTFKVILFRGGGGVGQKIGRLSAKQIRRDVGSGTHKFVRARGNFCEGGQRVGAANAGDEKRRVEFRIRTGGDGDELWDGGLGRGTKGVAGVQGKMAPIPGAERLI